MGVWCVCVCVCFFFALAGWRSDPIMVGKALGEPLTRITGPPMALLLLNECMSDEPASMSGEPASTKFMNQRTVFFEIFLSHMQNIVATWIEYSFHMANVFDDVMKTSHHIRWTFHQFSKKIS